MTRPERVPPVPVPAFLEQQHNQTQTDNRPSPLSVLKDLISRRKDASAKYWQTAPTQQSSLPERQMINGPKGRLETDAEYLARLSEYSEPQADD